MKHGSIEYWKQLYIAASESSAQGLARECELHEELKQHMNPDLYREFLLWHERDVNLATASRIKSGEVRFYVHKTKEPK